ncbi:WD40 repeat domain-containing protein [Streptomyces sp. NPDC049916]|uniref:WD40 repeat domain-containing protein n=1 Tax=Streptomyces sp. NPDC049916 TaxID=3155156 RepID=UPI0034205D1B
MRTVDVFHPRATSDTSAVHASPQTSVAFSPDGVHYASAGYDGRVALWDRTGTAPRWIGRHSRLVNGVRFSPSGRLLASGSADKTCRIWDVATGRQVQLLARQPDDLNALAWLDENRLVTVSQDGTGRIWDIRTGVLEDGVIFHADHCMSVDAAPTGVLASCGEDATIRLWDTNGALLRDLPQAGHAEMCRWSPDGTLLAASCDDGFVHIVRTDGELVTKVGPYTAAVKSVAWSKDGARIVIGAYDSTITLWDIADCRPLVRWYGAHLWPRSVDWSADGRTIIAGTFSALPAVIDVPGIAADALPGEVHEITLEAPVSTHGVNHVSAAGEVLAAGSDNGTVRVWAHPGATAREVPVGNGSLINTVAVSEALPGLVAYGSFSGRVGVADATTGEDVAFVERAHPVNRAAWSPDGKRLAVADYEGGLDLYTWTGDDLVPGVHYEGHDGSIKDVSWVDADRLVTYSTDRQAHLITAEGRLIRSFGGHGELINGGSVTRVAGRSLLATVSRDRTSRIYDLDTGELLQVLVGHDESAKCAAWHPGGEPLLVTGSYDYTGRLWVLDPTTLAPLHSHVLDGHGSAVSAVTWLGDAAVTASWDSRVVAWTPDADPARTPVPAELATDWTDTEDPR